jgi:hypothetical protein
VHLGTGAAVLSHKVHGSAWDCGLKGVGAVQGEVVSPVTGPVIVGHEEPLVDFAKNFGFDQLSF